MCEFVYIVWLWVCGFMRVYVDVCVDVCVCVGERECMCVYMCVNITCARIHRQEEYCKSTITDILVLIYV